MAEEMIDGIVCSREQFNLHVCFESGDGSKLFVTGDREFQTNGAIMLNALDWKLILVAS